MKRPNPAQWLWYAFGGKLPDRHREWVLRDVTSRTWLLRHIARSLTQQAPFLAALYAVFGLWLAGPPLIVFMAMAMGLIVGTYYSLSYAAEASDARLAKYGYPPRHGSTVRNQERGAAESARYAAMWRDSRE
ncbi:DUF5313 family protein [Actinokineospora iranica]|uniref:DUF5313 domain-containing protein n=1 Tax=Actinokineospora iranica TaxID=1271860 RepID=A0A1G6KIL9_9PSEU|nr:DUF5313 family protein [Actinokineospora iranica]SDC30678.1 hypothetical protein SAMN05216174_101927 [Actinokineospora iranica]